MNGLPVTVTLLLICSVAQSFKLFRVHVPHYRVELEDAVLECDYDLGTARLYAVKWYKDNEEFFRYVPRFKPPIKTHQVEGVRVSISESDSREILLKSLDLGSTGTYRCEISAEAPYFLTVHGEGRMTVIHLPKEGPQINGNLQDEYEIGDVLDLNCTSALSYPPARISWYINDQPVDVPWFASSPRSVKYSTRNTPTVTTLPLRLRLSASHFSPSGTAKVRCVASITTLFWEDENEIAFGNAKKSGLIHPTASQHLHTNHNYDSNEGDHFRLDPPFQGSRQNYHDDSNRKLTPNPFIFNSSALITVRGDSFWKTPSVQLVMSSCLLRQLF